jgi:hypothetical protein
VQIGDGIAHNSACQLNAAVLAADIEDLRFKASAHVSAPARSPPMHNTSIHR